MCKTYPEKKTAKLRLRLRKKAKGVTGAQWLSGRVLDSRPRVRASPASLRCGPWARHIYPSFVLVQPRKTRPCLTGRLLMGGKESNQTKQTKWEIKQCHLIWIYTVCPDLLLRSVVLKGFLNKTMASSYHKINI